MRHILVFIAVVVGCCLWVQTGMSVPPRDALSKAWVYLGTYTGKGSDGIYVAELDLSTGKLSTPKLACKMTNPSFLAIAPNGKHLYAVSEVETTGGKKGGGVTACSINAVTGELTPINSQLSGGGGPCHLTVDRQGLCVLVANYGDGTVASLPIRDGGKLEPAASVHRHQGRSVNQQRQEGPHAHSINVDAGNRFAIAADLGTDQMVIYHLDSTAGKLRPHQQGLIRAEPGNGPRHFAFHPQGLLAFANNELTSSVSSFRYDPVRGILTLLGTVSTLPTGSTGSNTTAEVAVHPTGKFVYVSNRGHDSIACFRCEEDGSLKLIGHAGTHGKTPRNFGIDPTGMYLLAANQGSNTVVVFMIDQETGLIKATGEKVAVGSPVCVKFLKK